MRDNEDAMPHGAQQGCLTGKRTKNAQDDRVDDADKGKRCRCGLQRGGCCGTRVMTVVTDTLAGGAVECPDCT